MLSHDTVWSALDLHARRLGMTPSGLARLAGLDPTTFNKSKRYAQDGRPRWPSTESVAKVLTATGSDLRTLFAEAFSGDAPAARTVPVIGYAHAGIEAGAGRIGFIAAEPAEMVALPGEEGERLDALRVQGDSMRPLYRDGDTLFISRSAPVEAGDRVVVKTKAGEVLVKILKRKTKRRMELHAVSPEHPDLALGMTDVDWTARIVWASQ